MRGTPRCPGGVSRQRRLMASFLFGVEPTDWMTFGVVWLVLTLVVVVASGRLVKPTRCP
jgi:hypothetical protein